MKTLKELWEENGCKPGLKVRYSNSDEYFVMMGKAPMEGLYGYNHRGRADYWTDDGSIKWELYSEPKAKLVLWRRRGSGEMKLLTNAEASLNLPLCDSWERISLSDLEGWER